MPLQPAPITGLAIGDALGMPFETETPLSTRLASWSGGYEASSYHRLKPGQFTDDTQMSMALATSLLRHKFYDPGDASRAYLSWFTSGDCRGIGTSTRQAMERLAHGHEWHASGIEGAEGNGSAMRIAPLGLFHHRGTDRLGAAAHWARIDSAITHKSEEAKEGSAAMAVAVSHLSSGGSKEDLLQAVMSHTEKSRTRYALEDIYRAIRRGDTFREVVTSKDWLLSGVGAHVVQTVPAAFVMFLYGENFPDTIRNAIRMGGDTDTTAAMTGALAGAFYGFEAIPKDLLKGLEKAGDIRLLETALAK